MPRVSRVLPVIVCLLLVCLWFSTGCALIEAPFAASKSRQKYAKFVLPDRDTVVIVEHTDNDPLAQQFARQVAATASRQLTDNGALTTAVVIDPARLVALQESTDAAEYKTMPIDTIGRELEAENVIYVQVLVMSLNARETLYRPEAQMQVRAVDALTGKRLFPQPDAPSIGGKSPAYPVVVGRTYETLDPATAGRTVEDRTRRALAQEAGLEVARLFYDWLDEMPAAGAEKEKRRLEAARRRDREQ